MRTPVGEPPRARVRPNAKLQHLGPCQPERLAEGAVSDSGRVESAEAWEPSTGSRCLRSLGLPARPGLVSLFLSGSRNSGALDGSSCTREPCRIPRMEPTLRVASAASESASHRSDNPGCKTSRRKPRFREESSRRYLVLTDRLDVRDDQIRRGSRHADVKSRRSSSTGAFRCGIRPSLHDVRITVCHCKPFALK